MIGQILRNVFAYFDWLDMADGGDELAKSILDQYGFIGFLTIGLED